MLYASKREILVIRVCGNSRLGNWPVNSTLTLANVKLMNVDFIRIFKIPPEEINIF